MRCLYPKSCDFWNETWLFNMGHKTWLLPKGCKMWLFTKSQETCLFEKLNFFTERHEMVYIIEPIYMHKNRQHNRNREITIFFIFISFPFFSCAQRELMKILFYKLSLMIYTFVMGVQTISRDFIVSWRGFTKTPYCIQFEIDGGKSNLKVNVYTHLGNLHFFSSLL